MCYGYILYKGKDDGAYFNINHYQGNGECYLSNSKYQGAVLRTYGNLHTTLGTITPKYACCRR